MFPTTDPEIDLRVSDPSELLTTALDAVRALHDHAATAGNWTLAQATATAHRNLRPAQTLGATS